jgi:hypothetical protein
MQAANSWAGQDAGVGDAFDAENSFNNSTTTSGTSALVPPPTPPSLKDLPAPSYALPSAGQVGQAAATPSANEADPPTPSSGQTEPSGAAPDPQAVNAFTTSTASDHVDATEFSSSLGKFRDAKFNIKVDEGETSVEAVPNDKITAGAMPGTTRPPQNGQVKIAGGMAQTSGKFNSENLTADRVMAALHSPQVSSRGLNAFARQSVVEPEAAANALSQPPQPPNPILNQQFARDSQPPALTSVSQNQTGQEPIGIQPSAAAGSSSGDCGAHANFSDGSTSGQAKSGQQNGTGPLGSAVVTVAPPNASSPISDPAGSLLTAHAATVAASHANTSAPPMAPSSTQQPTTLSAWQNYDGGAGKIVRSASITESAGSAEMHVELRSGPLGPLELHTVVHDGAVGAEIHVQGQEAHTLIAAGLPSLERALADRNLRVENLAVYQDHTGGGLGGGERQNSQSGSSPSPHRQAIPWENPGQPRSGATSSLEDEASANPAAGLSVQA